MRAGLLLVTLVLAACGGTEAVEPSEQPDAAPALAGTTLDGERLSLAEAQGKPVFVVAFSYF